MGRRRRKPAAGQAGRRAAPAAAAAAPGVEPRPSRRDLPWRNAARDPWLWGLLALAALLRLPSLGVPSLWFDEIRTLYMARDSILNVQSHFGFWWVTLAFLQLPLSTDIALRLFPALCGVAGVPVSYLIGYALRGHRVARWCAAIVALSVFHLFYSQEARFYAPMYLLTALSWLFTIRLFARSAPAWFFAAAACDVAAYTMHPTQTVYLGLHLAYVIGALALTRPGHAITREYFMPVRARSEGGGINAASTIRLVVAAATVIGSAWYARRFLSRITQINFDPEYLIGGLTPRLVGRHVQAFGGQFQLWDLPGGLYAWLYLAMLLVGLCVAWRRWRRDCVFAVMLTGGTFVASRGYEVSIDYAVKYVMFLMPFWAALAAQGFAWTARVGGDRLAARLPRLAARARLAPTCALVLIMAVASAFACFGYYSRGKIREKAAVRWLRDRLQPADEVMVYGHSALPINFYWRKFGLPADQYHALWWEPNELGGNLFGSMEALRRPGGKVYFIDSWDKDDPPRMAELLAQRGRMLREWPSFMGQPVRVYEIVPRAAPAGWPVQLDPLGPRITRNPSRPYQGEVAGQEALILRDNSTVLYDFTLAEGGPCHLQLQANAGPVQVRIIEVLVDGRLQGMVSFLAQEPAWLTRHVDLGELGPGEHVLTLRYLSRSGRLELEGATVEGVALRSLSIHPGPPPVGDSDLVRLDFMDANYPSLALRADDGTTGDLNPDWQPLNLPDWELVRVPAVDAPTTDGLTDAVLITMPPEFDGFARLLFDRAFPLTEQRVAYFAFDVRTERLYNHSINVGFLFLDESNEPVLQHMAYSHGLFDDMNCTGYLGEEWTEGWVPMAAIDFAPAGAMWFSPFIVLYDNPVRPSRHSGRVWIKDPRLQPIDTAPPVRAAAP
ncbi:MAG TPA: glycosyltransferase family 39 protein [Candidatus Sumerlaeota bacterium]|nr:glycosyltransferase family 39 protein [Candidatus Sumerlaeota bacterium]HPK01252.1 glycosyltransferase family 39 protein [Candidatus Sumerlaeota bacterium]